VGIDVVNRVSHVYLMGRDRIFGVDKGYFVLKDRDYGCRGKKKAETLKSLPQDLIVLKMKSSTGFCSPAESPFSRRA